MDWDKLTTHEELCAMDMGELRKLAGELRKEIIEQVSCNGGHLASSLGAVELILALHRVFDVRRSPLIFDVGHQSYAHKLLTGRGKLFRKLRQAEGCSGFPSPAESPFDAAVEGHAGTAISTALGMGAARRLDRCSDKIIAVVGDGALGNGISFEALNAASAGGKDLLLVLNDNRMSISPAVGAVSRRLSRIIAGKFYNRTRYAIRRRLRPWPRLLRLARRMDDWIKAAMLPPSALFQSFGFRFFGPVDGHSLPELISILERIRDLEGPLLLHVVTRKGKGASYAERSPVAYHGVGAFEAGSGRLPASRAGFSAAFGEWMCRRAAADERLIGVSAAMIPGVGLEKFASLFPDRCFDVGIAEEHAAVFSAGLALGGRRPVCALYATFAQRALDCIYHDAVLGKVPVIFAFDRAGAVPDGPTHHGIYDLGFLRALPGLPVMMPRNAAELELMLDYALTFEGPSVIRYPRGGDFEEELPEPAPLEYGKAQVLRESPEGPVIWALGAECGTMEKAARLLRKEGVEATLVNARFVSPFDAGLARRFRSRLQVTIEDHGPGGLAPALTEALAGEGAPGGVLSFNWGHEAVGYGSVAELRRKAGLDPENIVRRIVEKLSGESQKLH